MDKLYDLAIIGSGPAGMTAAIYAKRAGLDIILFEGSAPGGKLVKTFEIDNWPGQPNISGVDLAMKMYEHTTQLEVTTEYTPIVKIDVDKVKTLTSEDGRTFKTKAIILATGTVENKMGIPGEEAMLGKGVSFCAVCDGAFYKQKKVAVIGGGNSALEEAVYLTQFADEVTIVIRRDVFRGDVQAIERRPAARRHLLGCDGLGSTLSVALRDPRGCGRIVRRLARRGRRRVQFDDLSHLRPPSIAPVACG